MDHPIEESGAAGQRGALRTLCEQQLRDCNLIVASNRGPFEFKEEHGRTAHRKGQGGLVTAISSMVEVTDTTWIAAAMSEVDERVAAQNGGRVTMEMRGHPLTIAFVTPSPEQYHWYYDQVANSVLWFLQHNITNPPTHPTFDQSLWEAWQHGYIAVNRMFAERLAEEAERKATRPVFMVHDYHLYLVPGMLRERYPDALIQHFTHISWPGPDTWLQLPHAVREAIFTHMLGCDIVGFHCARYARNFVQCCQQLLGLSVDAEAGTVTYKDRVVRVADYPISIDPDALKALADTPDVLRVEMELMRHRPEQLILQVARTDPSKNILRSFYAYEAYLDQHPEMQGRVQFLGLLPTSRQSTELYKEYFQELSQVAARINADYGHADWEPIALFLDNDYIRAIAAMKHYDVLVVNSIADGMNLVAKEGPIVNRKHGVSVISEATGAAEELGGSAIVVNAFDLVGMADAFHQALTMPEPERQRMLEGQREAITRNTIFRWAFRQLEDLLGLRAVQAKPGPVTFVEDVESRQDANPEVSR